MNNDISTDIKSSIYFNQVNLLAWVFAENQNGGVMTLSFGITEIHVIFYIKSWLTPLASKLSIYKSILDNWMNVLKLAIFSYDNNIPLIGDFYGSIIVT